MVLMKYNKMALILIRNLIKTNNLWNQQVIKRFLSKANNPVIPINDISDKKISKEEAVLRCKLASLYRLVDKYGLTYGIYNHITARCPDNSRHFLINALGLNYEEVTAANLIKVDEGGNIIDRGTTQYGINRAGFVLHSAIHMARPDLDCVIHVHTHAGAAVSTLKCGLLPISQEAMIRGTFLSYHDYEGILVDENYRKKLANDLGQRNRLIMLHNHGLVTAGQTIEEAWNHLFDLTYACETQYRALAAASGNLDKIHLPSKDVQKQVVNVLMKAGGVQMDSPIKFGIGELEFEAEMRYLDHRGYKTGYPYKMTPVFNETRF